MTDKLVRLEDVEDMIKKELKIRTLHSDQDTLHELLSSLQSLPTHNEWISLEDKYPENNTRVLATNGDYTDTCQGYASEYSGTWLWDSNIKYTHWMPLPLPPTN